MRTEYHFQPTQPYGLHDTHIRGMEIRNGNLHLAFAEGFVRLEEPYPRVKGFMTAQGIDPDFCTVMLLSKNGQYGTFTGHKYSLAEFLSKHPVLDFEVVGEFYGYNKLLYNGYLSIPQSKHLAEMQLEVYYEGDIVYQTEEEVP